MRFLIYLCLWSTVLATSMEAIQFRNNSDLANNLRFDGSLTTPSGLSVNENFILKDFDTTGIGYYVQDRRRQFALVSPQHFICANHFLPVNEGTIRFLGSDGVVYTYTIEKTETIEGSNGPTDLSLGTLKAPVDTSVISPLPYANLIGDSSYAGSGFVFGKEAKAGITTFGGVSDFSGTSLTDEENINNTRMINLAYNGSLGVNDDSFLERGDSGSPSFLQINGKLALVAGNSAVIQVGTSQTALGTFVPFYVDELNALMADEGFQLTAATPTPLTTSLGANEGVTVTLRQAYSGGITIDVSNNGSQKANNLEIRLTNLSSIPSTVAGTSFVKNTGNGGTIVMNRAFLEAGQTGQITLEWNPLPAVTSISFDVAVGADEADSLSFSVSEAVLPSFRQFISTVASQGVDGDDDRDGIGNLVEYASGGDLGVSSVTTAEGVILGLSIGRSDGDLELSFLRRTNADDLGLSYTINDSTDLTDEGEPLDLSSAPESDAAPGYEKLTLQLDPSTEDHFFTLKIDLDEDPAE